MLRESGGFRMGAFELTDLIGQDVNESVTHSVWQAFFQDVRFSGRPWRSAGSSSPAAWAADRARLVRPRPRRRAPRTAHRRAGGAAREYIVAEGGLGPASELLTLIREAGIEVREEAEDEGTRLVLPGGGQLVLADGQASVEFSDVVYFDLALDYRAATRIALSHCKDTSARTVAEATGLFQALGKKVSVIGDVPGMIVARTVARIIDLAVEAVAQGVATEEDVDIAMRLMKPSGLSSGAAASAAATARRPAGRDARDRSVRPLRALPRALPVHMRRREREDTP
ncbi:3-hydroxybutyryl-CoA dehydrogenase OS=Streptomyces albaduncus OX=68172 GN=FHS32_004396 PE=3 SV=1 [Streptomyces griseoloalbus]